MKSVQEWYEAYRIMPSLQRHQLRVAAVAKIVCDHIQDPVDANVVLLACLFHDMGNIIKSDLTTFPEFVEPEGYDHWKKVKDDYAITYGPDEHHANIAIAQAIGLPEKVIALIQGVGFSKLETTRDERSLEQKIVEYADQRVGPYGVLALDERIAEAAKRYADKRSDIPRSQERFTQLVEAAHEVERQLFSRSSIKPDDINDISTTALIEGLRNYPVE